MTSPPESVDIQGPGLPRDPAEYGLRRSGLGAAFWAMIAVGLIMVFAGLAFAHFGPRLFPARTTSPGPATSAPIQNGGAGQASVGGAAAPIPAGPTAAPAISPPATTPQTAEIAALGLRVDRLQADQQRASQASGEALAAAALSEAAQSPRRFDDQLAGLDPLLPDTSDLRALRALAQTGAPTRQALAAQFPALADRAVVAARAPPPGSSILTRVVHALASIFTVRRVDVFTGDSPDAVLARAQQAVDAGDLEGAVRQLDRLPAPGAAALSAWRAQAGQRIEIDRLVANIRAAAVRDFAASGAAPRGATP